jgi:hypothetical protein
MELQSSETRIKNPTPLTIVSNAIRDGLQIRAVNGQGLGVFARRLYEENEIILAFGGAEVASEKILDFTHFMQISPQSYLGPSGQLDDYINHNCDPNSAAFFQEDILVLKAIRDIKIEEQLSIDYSTIIFNEPTIFECACHSKNCRKTIGNFYSLSSRMQRAFLKKGIVPLLSKYSREQIGF